MAPRWADLQEGTQREPREYGPLTRTDFVRYQGASGDFNPIHHDEEFAREAGFPTVFSVGMLQAGILAGYCADWLGADNVRRFAVQFREQVWPGDRLACEASVARAVEVDGERRVDLDLRVTRLEPSVRGAGILRRSEAGPERPGSGAAGSGKGESSGLAITGTATFVVP